MGSSDASAPVSTSRSRSASRSRRGGVENNLSLANMGFEEFADAVDEDGVFRGFRDP